MKIIISLLLLLFFGCKEQTKGNNNDTIPYTIRIADEDSIKIIGSESKLSFNISDTGLNTIMTIWDDGKIEIRGDTLTVLKYLFMNMLKLQKELSETKEANKLQQYLKPDSRWPVPL